MNELIANAHVHLLITFQATGLKLKLLSSLYRGRFHIVNSKMLSGTGLDDQCMIAESPEDIIKCLQIAFKQEFTTPMAELRREKLSVLYNNKVNAGKLLRMIFQS